MSKISSLNGMAAAGFGALLTLCLSTQALKADDTAPVRDGAFHLSGPPKIAMLLYYQDTDGGWTKSFDEARRLMEKELGVKIDYIDNVDDGGVRVNASAERLIAQGYNILIGTAYSYSDALLHLSKKYPNVAFLNAGGTTTGPNLQSFYGRSFYSQYLCGMVAGAMSKSGRIGYVASINIPIVDWDINGFTLGVRQSNPRAKVYLAYTGSWANPGLERRATNALIDDGADVIGQDVDTPQPQRTAQKRGVLAIGRHRDMSEFAPKATMCSSVWRWERYLQPEIRKIIAGTWAPGPEHMLPSFKDGPTEIALNEALVPSELIAKVMAERQALLDGKDIFAGPVRDQSGKVVRAKGQSLSDEDMWKMHWHVEGVVTQDEHNEAR